MKSSLRAVIGVILALLFCGVAVPAHAERYVETEEGTLLDIQTGAVWERQEASLPTALATVPIVRGLWRGSWTSHTGAWGALGVRVTQSGRRLSGTMNVSNTDCGNLYGVPFIGSISLNNLITITTTTSCQGNTVRLRYTRGRVSGALLSGTYSVVVNGSPYDSGTFRLQRR